MNRILIVEDEMAISDLIKIGLESQGYKCEIALDGEKAADFIEQKEYDLVLLDIMLPKVDGYELLEYIKQTKQIPVIFITAKSEVKDKVKGLKEGADDYWLKIKIQLYIEKSYLKKFGEKSLNLKLEL